MTDATPDAGAAAAHVVSGSRAVPVDIGAPRDQTLRGECEREIAARVADGRYPPGQWLPKFADIAQELGVSLGTVQQALARLTARGVIARAARLGYYPASGSPPPRDPARQRPRYAGGPRRDEARDEPGDGAAGWLEQHITPAELAEKLRISAAAVRRLAAEGRIPGAVQVTRRDIRIPVSGAQAYLDACALTAAPGDRPAAAVSPDAAAPGLVEVRHWRAGDSEPQDPAALRFLGGVGRKA